MNCMRCRDSGIASYYDPETMDAPTYFPCPDCTEPKPKKKVKK